MITLSESLEQYAVRKGIPVSKAYQRWHQHGVNLAEDFQKPVAPSALCDVEIKSGRVFGLFRNGFRASEYELIRSTVKVVSHGH